MSDPLLETEQRRVKRAAELAAERARTPHDAVVVCDRCTETHRVEAAEKYTDADLAVAFYKAGWDLTRGQLCPAHRAVTGSRTASRARADRQRWGRR